MAIYIKTCNPQGLLNDIRKGIEDKVIQSWCEDEEGDLTQAFRWRNKAWFKPSVDNNVLIFGLIGRKDEPMTKFIYGIYHSRFSEMLLTQFDSTIEDIKLTPNGIDGIDSFQ